jgi:hypothetical protein
LNSSNASKSSPKSASHEAPLLALCVGEFVQYEAKIESSFVLNQKFLGKNSELLTKKFLMESVRQQLNFAQGFLINNFNRSHRTAALSAEDPAVAILSLEETHYSRAMAFQPVGELPIPNKYLEQAYAAGRTEASDPAVRVHYSARFKLGTCGVPMETIVSQLPLDPWLAYFSVGRSDRQVYRWNQKKAEVFPCATNELADFPEPTYLWYFWSPLRRSLEPNLRWLNCETLLQDVLVTTPIVLTAPHSSFARSHRHKVSMPLQHVQRPREVSLIFGTADHNIKHFSSGEINGRIAFDRVTGLRVENTRQLERGLYEYLFFLGALSELMHIENMQRRLKDNSIEITLLGRLVQSGQAVRLRTFFGPTDVFAEEPPQHWDFAQRSLRSDVIIYAGHSGLGRNMSLREIQRSAQATKRTASHVLRRAPRAQMFAYLSCYSYSYFGNDMRRRIKRSKQRQLDLILTLSPFTSVGRGALGVLEVFEAALTNREVSHQNSYLKNSDKVIQLHF